MSIDPLKTLYAIEALENYIEKHRPPEHIRPELDIGYRIENQSIYLFEIRPQWNNPSVIRHLDFAKTTFVKTKSTWKVFWIRANGKWYPYDPKSTVKSLDQFLKLVEEDKYHCFKG